MSRIFISYSRQDQEFAQQLVRDLETWGVDVWIDQDDIVAGSDWTNAIQEGLDSSDLMLLIVSPDSMASENVRDEWHYFKEEGKPLIPIMHRTTRLHFQLRRLQYIDFDKQDYAVACDYLRAALESNDISVEEPSQSEPALVREPVNVLDILPEPFEWINIPAGQVTLAHSHGTFDVLTFKIAKYPVTYAQYQVFIDAADGFHNVAWWEDLAADKEHQHQPGEQQWKIADHPCERVSWWDAITFCRWLSQKTSLDITLPTELQWQRAAQGDDGRSYPWGNQFDVSRCNTDEAEIGQTTPITRYLNGASPYSVLDMSGNVWEWCLNKYDTPTNTDLSGNAQRVLRGGSWVNDQGLAGCAYRAGYNPRLRDYDVGFRVVSLSPLSIESHITIG